MDRRRQQSGPVPFAWWPASHHVSADGWTSQRGSFAMPRAMKFAEERLASCGSRSPGVSPGYLDRPDLTATAFRPSDPALGHRRSYRTGDLVLRIDDETFEYVGRVDRQRKIRGNRIELDEIEFALSACRGVNGVAVVVLPDGRIRAAVATAADDLNGLYEQLRATAAARLPAAVVPNEYTFLSALPLGPTEKLDEAALLTAEPFHPGGGEPLDLTDPMIRLVVNSISQMLGTDRLEQDQELGQTGLDSLSLVQLRLRLGAATGRPLNATVVHATATVSEVAAACHARQAGQDGLVQREVATHSDTLRSPIRVPLTPAQRRVLIDEGGTLRRDNVLRVLLATEDSADELAAAAEGLLAAADVFRVREVSWKHGDGFLIIDQRPVDRVERLDEVDAPAMVTALLADGRAVDVAGGQLVRCAVATAGELAYLYLAMHHVIADGMSLEIVKALVENRLCSPDTTPRGGSFASWVQATRTRNTIEDALVARWQDVLRGWEPNAGSDATPAPALMTQVRRIAVPLVPNRRDTHMLMLAASAHLFGHQASSDHVACRVVRSGRQAE